MASRTTKRIEWLVARMRERAATGTWNGRGITSYFERCRHTDIQLGMMALYTRDEGHHTSGWWKNPEYERCLHLSLSFFDPETRDPAPRDERLTQKIIAALFGDDARKLWCEPPTSADGKKRQVWHYRLFCDTAWQPIKPRGEVYSRKYTSAGWKSYSDVQAEMRAISEEMKQLGIINP